MVGIVSVKNGAGMRVNKDIEILRDELLLELVKGGLYALVEETRLCWSWEGRES